MPVSSIPQASDFPAELQPVIQLPLGPAAAAATPAAATPALTNVVLFLPGLGDSSANFANFARALNLPDTLAITLQPPFPLPFPVGPGSHWADELLWDQSTGALDFDSPCGKAVDIIVEHVILNPLIRKLKYQPGEIHLFGYGQGGAVALAVPLHPALSAFAALGSVISIGGALALSTPLMSSLAPKNRTPVLLLGGSKGVLASNEQSPVKRTKSFYEYVEYHQWKRADDSTPKTRDEALPMMQFLARRLRSRRGVPDDAVEIS